MGSALKDTGGEQQASTAESQRAQAEAARRIARETWAADQVALEINGHRVFPSAADVKTR
jgi:hypothetical protein